MPSADAKVRAAGSRSSLARRVGWTAGVASFAAGAATLLVAMVVVDHLERREATNDATSLARAVARELGSSDAGGRPALEAEVREFTHGGVSIGIIDRDGAHLAGVPLPAPEGADSCVVRISAGTEWFVCGADDPRGRRVLVGETTEALLAHRAPLLMGGTVALLVVFALSVLAGVFVGRWALAPLARLEAAVARIEAAQPDAHPPLARSGLREVDAIAHALDDLLEQLSAELARSRRFSADAAHELRTPLSKLRAELELVAEDLSEGTDRDALLRAVSRTEDLANLVDRLLLLASPAVAVRSETLTSLAVVLETTVAALDPAVAARVRVSLDSDGLVRGDEAVLRSVVANALDNALKYSEGEVRARVVEESGVVVLRVDDDGPGLGGARDRAFEPFYRGPDHRGRVGHGVGLALIAHVVRAHGGTARFLTDEPGAKLELRLPAHSA